LDDVQFDSKLHAQQKVKLHKRWWHDYHWHRQLRGTGARATPPQLPTNLSGHFRAAETLTFRLHVVSYPAKTVRCLLCILRHTSAPRSLHGGITYYYCILFLCHP